MTKESIPNLLLISSPQTSKNDNLPLTDLLAVEDFRNIVQQFDRALRLPEYGSLHPDRQIATVVYSVAAHTAFVNGLTSRVEPGLLDSTKHRFGLRFMGHSIGEMAALIEAGVCDIQTMAWMLNEREKITEAPLRSGLRLMAAVVGIDTASFEQNMDSLEAYVGEIAKVHLANLNTPRQVVVAVEVFKGEAEPVLARLATGLSALSPRAQLIRLKAQNAFHSAAMKGEEGLYMRAISPFLDRKHFKDPPEGVIYSPMLPGWIDTRGEAVDVTQHILTRRVQFTKAAKEAQRIPDLVGIVTADFIDITPDLMRRNIGNGIPIWNIKNQATLEQAIEGTSEKILQQAA